jgi:hypothetical protein
MASLVTLCSVSFAATVVLRDGTVIQGEVVSLHDGVYTIDTDSAGTLHVRKQEVRSIDENAKSSIRPGVGLVPDASSPAAGVLDAAKSRIVEDPKVLAMVLALQNDPAVMAVLADPEITKAIEAGDYSALMNNPKILALMNNEKVREVIDQTR